MGGKPEEKYNPGELTRTRSNLGPLSVEESKKMSEILGGEIGIEKTDSNIEQQYRELKNRERRKSGDKLISGTGSVPGEATKKEEYRELQYTYFERLKLYNLAVHPDHGIKSVKHFVLALFDFFSKQKNYINPVFIEKSNSTFFKNISNLVDSVRFIIKNVQKKYIRREEHPYNWRILDTIAGWEIDSLQQEIIRLKKDPEKVTLADCRAMIEMIYTPLILLFRTSREDMENALKYAFRLSIMGLTKKDLQGNRLRRSFAIALDETDKVFRIIKYRLYPLLLMSVSTRVYDYRTTFRVKWYDILNFLDIKSSDIISHRDKDSKPTEGEETVAEENSEAQTEEYREAADLGIHQGILLLDRMFPGAGWNKLDSEPDMFPYFKKILDLPEDAAIVSPADNLQRIIILLAVLKDLFYGFSNLEYGFYRDETGKPFDLKDILNPIIGSWYLFMDELITKHYLNPLHEYCRLLERSNDFPESHYAKRLASDILWVRKKYLNPNIMIHLPKIMQPRITISTPELFKTVDKLKMFLERIVLETFSNGELAVETLQNPDGKPGFEIDRLVVARIRKVLFDNGQEFTNRTLVLSAYEIIMVLNDLIMDSGRNTEIEDVSGLFRSEEGRGIKPVYSVSESTVFYNMKNRKTELEINPADETEGSDPVTGFFGKQGFRNSFLRQLASCGENDCSSSVMLVNIQGFESISGDEAINLLEKAGKSISRSIRLLKDIPFRTEADSMYILLPDTDITGARKAAKRIIGDTNLHGKLYIALVEFKEGMEEENIFSQLKKAMAVSKKLPAPVTTYLDPSDNQYKHE